MAALKLQLANSLAAMLATQQQVNLHFDTFLKVLDTLLLLSFFHISETQKGESLLATEAGVSAA